MHIVGEKFIVYLDDSSYYCSGYIIIETWKGPLKNSENTGISKQEIIDAPYIFHGL